MVATPTTFANSEPAEGSSEGGGREPHGRGHLPPQHLTTTAFVVVLLILATVSQGAFQISRWAPLGLFALALLLGSVMTHGRLAATSWPVRVALAGIWGLAAWSVLSMLWAQSSADAFQAGCRDTLYAAMATLPFGLPLSRRALALASWALAAGIGVLATYITLRLVFGDPGLFLAGRLNGPVNYRNATALLFSLPVWAFITAAASRRYARPMRAGAMFLATLCLGLAFLTQSRGIVLGLAIGGVVALGLGPERVRRTWVAIVVLGLIGLSAHWLLRPFHAFDGGEGYVTHHDIVVAARALVITAVAAFAVGFAIALFDGGLRAHSESMKYVHRAARVILAIGTVAAVVAALAATGNPVHYLHKKWDQFHSLNSTTPSGTRLLTTGGQRYDLWRVALKEFDAHPIGGVGADNYEFGYYQHRATNRNLSDPHSLLFAQLAETGIIGTGLLVLYLTGIAATIGRGWRRLGPGERLAVIGPVAAGAVFFGQSLVDWMYLIPGLTSIAIFALSAGAAQVAWASSDAGAGGDAAEPSSPSQPAARWRAYAVRVPAGLALLAGCCALLALFLSDAYIQHARAKAGDPASELSAARGAAALDPWSVVPHYLEASAYEDVGDYKQSFDELNDALRLEPHNSASLVVLGDFEVRRGNLPAARSYYQRALALDPLDTGYQQLARIGLKGSHVDSGATAKPATKTGKRAKKGQRKR